MKSHARSIDRAKGRFGTLHKCLRALILFWLVGCGDAGHLESDQSLTETHAVTGGFTPHFDDWLNARGQGAFARTDLPNASFGGRTSDSDQVHGRPVIFVHGNSDRALGTSASLTGWKASRAAFLAAGYDANALYATTWGPANVAYAALQTHSNDRVAELRAFILAVREYTGAPKVDIVAHSLGVTLARSAAADLGVVHTFVGIAGANRGLANCFASPLPTCNGIDGLSPGYMVGLLGPFGVSQALSRLNDNPHSEAHHVYSIWTKRDDVVMYGCIVWGRNTCQIPGQDDERVYEDYSHNEVKDQTTAIQLEFLSR